MADIGSRTKVHGDQFFFGPVDSTSWHPAGDRALDPLPIGLELPLGFEDMGHLSLSVGERSLPVRSPINLVLSAKLRVACGK